MPLKLIPPRWKNPNYAIRGSYLTVKRLYRSTGTADRKIAEQALRALKRDIESGAFAPEVGPTFAAAVSSYLRAGGEDRFARRLLEYFQFMPLAAIDQAAIDQAAAALYPEADAATRNRQVYTPVSAILKHAGLEKPIKRPKGSRGKLRLHWLAQEQAFALLEAAEAIEPRFGALCTFLLYTGCRLSEALRLKWTDVDLQGNFAYVRDTKNGEPRPVFMPPVVVAALANLESEVMPTDGTRAREDTERRTIRYKSASNLKTETYDIRPPRATGAKIFRYSKGRWLYRLLAKAEEKSGVKIPDGIAFHIFRHTYGAWMRRHAGLDTSGLVATRAWKSKQAASVYEHVEFSEEAAKAALLPVRKVK